MKMYLIWEWIIEIELKITRLGIMFKGKILMVRFFMAVWIRF